MMAERSCQQLACLLIYNPAKVPAEYFDEHIVNSHSVNILGDNLRSRWFSTWGDGQTRVWTLRLAYKTLEALGMASGQNCSHAPEDLSLCTWSHPSRQTDQNTRLKGMFGDDFCLLLDYFDNSKFNHLFHIQVYIVRIWALKSSRTTV